MEPYWFSLSQAVGCWDLPAAASPAPAETPQPASERGKNLPWRRQLRASSCARRGESGEGGHVPGAASLRRGFLLLWDFRGLRDKPVLEGGKVAKEKRYLQNPLLRTASKGDQPSAMGWPCLSCSTPLWSMERNQGESPPGGPFLPAVKATRHRCLATTEPLGCLGWFLGEGLTSFPSSPPQGCLHSGSGAPGGDRGHPLHWSALHHGLGVSIPGVPQHLG